jgi:hypothetical protein
MKSISVRLLVPLLLVFACGREEAASAASRTASHNLVVDNGVSLNGVSLNGVSLNGVSLNGVSLNGVSLNGVSLNGVSLNGVSLNGVSLNGVSLNGVSLNGADLVGSIWQGTLSSGVSLPLRIDSVQPGTAPNADVLFYGVSYSTQTGWTRLCGNEPDSTPVLAVPVAGVWNYGSDVPGGGAYTADSSQFTFGCRHNVIAKCVEMGYKPWKTLPSGTGSLRDHHVACTRAMRADYCGDGEVFTINGTLIDIYDNIGVQLQTQPSWILEAEWTTAGARCMGPEGAPRFYLVQQKKPDCYKALISNLCGSPADFQVGALLMDRYAGN